MSARRRFLWAGLVAAAGLALGVLATRLLLEPVDEPIDRGFRGAAAADRLLALDRLLTELGVPVTRARGFARLPPTGYLLLVSAPHRSLGPRTVERLLEWTATGGHLVVVPTPCELGDPILQELGVLVTDRTGCDQPPARGSAQDADPGSDAEPDSDADAGADAGADADPDADPDANADGEVAPGARGLRQPLRLIPVFVENTLSFETRDDGLALLALTWGRGRVSVLSESWPLTNEGIGHRDNARWAWRTLVPDARPAGAWLIDRDRRPSPWALLAGRAAPATVALLALLLAWGWKAATRFGPLLPEPESDRRSLAEHLRASGRWLWSSGASRALVDACRLALHRRLRRGHDGSLDELAFRAASAQGLDAETVRLVLQQRAPADRLEFTRCIRVLELLRRASR